MTIDPITFTPMTPDHLEEVLAIEGECFSSPWSREAFKGELSLAGISFYTVALDGGEVVGYGGYRFAAGEMHITNLAVKESVRRKGIAKRLTELLISEGARRGAKQAHLEVRRSNLSAQDLYRSMGFENVGVRREYYRKEKEDAILMSKGLFRR